MDDLASLKRKNLLISSDVSFFFFQWEKTSKVIICPSYNLGGILIFLLLCCFCSTIVQPLFSRWPFPPIASCTGIKGRLDGRSTDFFHQNTCWKGQKYCWRSDEEGHDILWTSHTLLFIHLSNMWLETFLLKGCECETQTENRLAYPALSCLWRHSEPSACQVCARLCLG